MFNLNEVLRKGIADYRKVFKGSDEEFDALIKSKSAEMVADISPFFLRNF